jgi:DNA-binding NarL/FixJ family response regulator
MVSRVPRRVRGLGGHRRGLGLDVDPIAVERAIGGERMPLTVPERLAATQRLTAAGMSANEIALRLGVASRTVTRYRARAS